VTYTDSRATYRTIELSEGRNGRIISNELYLSTSHLFLVCFHRSQLLTDNPVDILDGAMGTIAMYTINIGYSGLLLGSFWNKRLDADITA